MHLTIMQSPSQVNLMNHQRKKKIDLSLLRITREARNSLRERGVGRQNIGTATSMREISRARKILTKLEKRTCEWRCLSEDDLREFVMGICDDTCV